MELKTIDLCAGIGGIRRGFELAGGYVNVLSAEIDEMACQTYRHLFNEDPFNDITCDGFKRSLQSNPYDVLLAGFPCQAFSSVGLRHGFQDKTKGTIFFDIAEIIKISNPKVVFLENVQNLLSHNNKSTFNTIVETLDVELNYHIVGVTRNDNGELQYDRSSFIRNSRDFGIPQNRPRVYIVGFSRAYFGDHISLLPKETPTRREGEPIYSNLEEILDVNVEARYFLSSGYLACLENHHKVQRIKGNGFGYQIVNAADRVSSVANTLLATGGSGKERNLIYDYANGSRYAGISIKGKKTPINDKCIRVMTPNEWGRLQGFVGYGFADKDGVDSFSFPEQVSNVHKYKQLGNSVTIPVIEEFARFIKRSCDLMYSDFSSIEKRVFELYGNKFLLCYRIFREFSKIVRHTKLNLYIDLVEKFELKYFTTEEAGVSLNLDQETVSQLLTPLKEIGCLIEESSGTFCFKDLTSLNFDSTEVY